jgi:AcrR family transcriptional regulator
MPPQANSTRTRTRTRNPEATKARLLAAATGEFATYGIAGARIDRIEAAAKANRALIYSYFGSKDGLFDAVMDAAVAHVLAAVPFTPEDLPGYAGRLFDFLVANPHQLRLATWHRLERSGSGRETAGLTDSHRANTAAVAHVRQQAAPFVAADDLYVFTLAIASSWLPGSPYAPAGLLGEIRHRRAAVVEAVRRLAARDGSEPDAG